MKLNILVLMFAILVSSLAYSQAARERARQLNAEYAMLKSQAKISSVAIKPVLRILASGPGLSSAEIHDIRKILSPQQCIDRHIPFLTPENYVSEVQEYFRPYYNAMVDAGATYVYDDPKPYWDIDAVDLSHETLLSHPKLVAAISLFFSMKTAKELLKRCRDEIVVIGDPYDQDRQFIVPKGPRGFRVAMKRQRWEESIRDTLARFRRDAFELRDKTIEATSFWQTWQGVMWRNGGDSSPAQVAANGLYKIVRKHIDILRYLGSSDEIIKQTNRVIKDINSLEKAQLEGLVSQIETTYWGILLSPTIPIGLYVAPATGALVGLSVKTSANAAGMFILFPAAATYARSAIHAGIESKNYLEFYNNYSKNMANYGPGFLLTAPFLGLIPSGMHLAAAGTGGIITAVGYNGPAIYNTVAFQVNSQKVLGGINLATATSFLTYMGYHEYVNIDAGLEELRLAKALTEGNLNPTDADIAKANLHLQEAYRKFADVGIDITMFFSPIGFYLYKARPFRTMARIRESKPVDFDLPVKDPNFSSMENQIRWLQTKYGTADGAKLYWGKDTGNKYFNDLLSAIPELPSFAAKNAWNPMIAPWAKNPAFSRIVNKLKTEATQSGQPIDTIMTGSRFAKELGIELGEVTVYRALRLSDESLAYINAHGMQPGAIRNGIPTAETGNSMLSYRLGGHNAGYRPPFETPEVMSNFNSVSVHEGIAMSVASCESSVTNIAGNLPLYLFKMQVPRNQVLNIGHSHEISYPQGSFWRGFSESSPVLKVQKFNNAGELTAETVYRANNNIESFIFGSVARSKIQSIEPFPDNQYYWSWAQ